MKSLLCTLLAITTFLAVERVATADCSVPAAIPNDGKDDRVAIQAAIDKQGCADLGPGVYDIGVNPGVGMAGITALALKDGKSIRGSGPATVLRFYGVAHGDWNGIRMSGANTLVSDLLIDDSALTGTTEQTHAIQVQGSSAYLAMIGITTGATIRGVWINHPVRHTAAGAEYLGGDCIRLLGEEISRINVTIVGNHLLACDRSGVAFQRGAYGVVLSDNIFYWTGDSDIDAEMTGTGIGGDWVVSNNIALAGHLRHNSMAFAGTLVRDLTFTGNILLGGGLNAYNLQHATVTGNVIVYAVPDAAPAVQMIKGTDDVVFSDNVVVRSSTSLPGLLLDFEPHTTTSPGRITVADNALVQQTKYATAVFVSVQDLVFTGNRLHYEAAASTAANGVQVTSSALRISDRLVVADNLFTGPIANAVYLQAGVSHVAVTGNLADQATTGLMCFPGASLAITSSGNNWTRNACAVSTPGI